MNNNLPPSPEGWEKTTQGILVEQERTMFEQWYRNRSEPQLLVDVWAYDDPTEQTAWLAWLNRAEYALGRSVVQAVVSGVEHLQDQIEDIIYDMKAMGEYD